MTHGHPIVIYDKFARTGLKQRVGKDLTNYQLYHRCWLQEFSGCKTQIRAAQAWLPESILVARLARYGVATEKELRSWVRQPWFANRIFDQYLMHIGKGGTNQRKRAIDAAQLLDPAEAGI
jgi:hypothetical protein